MSNYPEYEFPLNEFIRNALKVDRLLSYFQKETKTTSELGLRNILSRLLELHALLSRSELKNELIKELEKKIKRLSSMELMDSVDHSTLNNIIRQLNDSLKSLKGIPPDTYSKPLPYLIDSVKQRDSVPGGQFDFDLPAYKCWLSSDPDACYQEALGCISDYLPITRTIDMYMDLLRQSSQYIRHRAENGFLQLNDNEKSELLIIRLQTQNRIYPEISGGKHRVFVRFMELTSIDEKPLQTKKDIEFEVKSCFI